MFNKSALILGIVLGLMTVLATPASANILQSAVATANCQGYTLTAVAHDLGIGTTYTINYNFVLTCNGGSPVNVPGSIVFKATAHVMTVTASGTFPGLIGSCTVSGTATLVDKHPRSIPIVVNGVLVAPLTCTLPTANCAVIVAEQGVPIAPVTLVASGGAGPPYTFTATGLPAGLTISPSGTISGTPTVNGVFNYTVTITDAAGNKGTINCSVTVNPPLQVTCYAINVGEVGIPFNSGPMTVTGGTPPYTFSVASGSIPPGLTLNPSTGAVSGTATSPGTFSIKVTDSLGAMGTGCVITINPPLQVTCYAINVGEVGIPFNSGPMTVTGGTPPYTFSVASGSIPSGLTLNPSTGAVSGTATSPGTFSIKVTDSLGAMGTGCVITINPPLQVTCSATNTGTVGVPFDSGPMGVTGGTPPYVFSIGSGTLPPGLTLNTSTGEVTGTPTAPGTFTIIVTDSLGAVGTGCTITINSSVCLSSQLGSASGFGILGLQNANIQLSSGPLQVNANVGIGVNGQLNLSGGAVLQGTLFADPTATVKISGGSGFAGGIKLQPMTPIQNAALAEAAAVGALPPTQTFSQIQNAITITGNGGQNVIQVNGPVHLSGGHNLTISGGANDSFIFNIAGGFQLDGGANIVLNGVAPNQVLWYFPGSGDQIQTSGKANTEGIFLAPQRNIQINGGTHVSEFISGGTLSFQSNPIVNAIPSCGPGPQQLTVTKTADSSTVTAGSLAGFTVTIGNTGGVMATGVTLSDPLPAGAGNDIDWMIDTTTGNPADFTVTGAVGSQVLTLNPSVNTLAAGASLTVHITGLTTVNDAQPGAALNLGTDNQYIFIDTGATHLGWNAYQLDGNVLFGQGLTVQLSGGNNGGLGAGYSVYLDSTVNVSGSLQNPLTFVSVPTSQTAAAAATAQSVSQHASGLTATQTFGSINNNLTINGNGGLNVIDVGSVQNANLTINGSANDYFVFNVSTGIQTNRVMTLTGGVTASHILWNLTGTGTVLQTSGGNILVGTFLATNGGAFQFSELQLTGELINTGGNVQLVSGNHTLIQAGFTPPSLSNTATVNATNVTAVSATATITIIN